MSYLAECGRRVPELLKQLVASRNLSPQGASDVFAAYNQQARNIDDMLTRKYPQECDPSSFDRELANVLQQLAVGIHQQRSQQQNVGWGNQQQQYNGWGSPPQQQQFNNGWGNQQQQQPQTIPWGAIADPYDNSPAIKSVAIQQQQQIVNVPATTVARNVTTEPPIRFVTPTVKSDKQIEIAAFNKGSRMTVYSTNDQFVTKLVCTLREPQISQAAAMALVDAAAKRPYPTFINVIKYNSYQILDVPVEIFNKTLTTIQDVLGSSSPMDCRLGYLHLIKTVLQSEPMGVSKIFIKLMVDRFNMFARSGFLTNSELQIPILENLEDIDMLAQVDSPDENIRAFQVEGFMTALEKLCEYSFGDYLTSIKALEDEDASVTACRIVDPTLVASQSRPYIRPGEIVQALQQPLSIEGHSPSTYADLLSCICTSPNPDVARHSIEQLEQIAKICDKYTVLCEPRQVVHVNVSLPKLLAHVKDRVTMIVPSPTNMMEYVLSGDDLDTTLPTTLMIDTAKPQFAVGKTLNNELFISNV